MNKDNDVNHGKEQGRSRSRSSHHWERKHKNKVEVEVDPEKNKADILFQAVVVQQRCSQKKQTMLAILLA
eukprot:12884510-Ditylum_brightwellii.AAC.1